MTPINAEDRRADMHVAHSCVRACVHASVQSCTRRRTQACVTLARRADMHVVHSVRVCVCSVMHLTHSGVRDSS